MNLSKLTIGEEETLSKALQKLNAHSAGVLLLFVIDKNNKLVGSLTDGDIRRGLIDGVNLTDIVNKVMFTDFVFATSSTFDETLLTLDINNIKLLPIVDEQNKLINVINLLTYKSSARLATRTAPSPSDCI